MARLIYLLCILSLCGCQTDISSKDQVVKGNADLKTSDGVLDLSQFSQEQQKVEREQAARRREELKAGRVVLEANNKEKIKLIIEKINKRLTLIEKIKKFILIHEEFTIENGMLTPTLKLKRKEIIKNYKQQLENLY